MHGNAAPHQRGGWSMPEDGFTWTIGPSSQIELPVPLGRGPLMLEMQVVPFLAPPLRAQQRLTVTAGATRLGREVLTGPTRLAFRVPRHAVQGADKLTITLTPGDPGAPADFGHGADQRALGVALHEMQLYRARRGAPVTSELRAPIVLGERANWDQAVRAATGLALTDLLQGFESLGHNCEFGLMQRALGADPIGLLRFGAITPENLLRALASDFADIERPGNLALFTGQFNGREEYLLRHALYGMEMHTHHYVGDITPDALLAKLSTHLGFLRRHFAEHLAAKDRIFVLHHPSITSPRRAMPLRNRLGGNTLLYVTAEDTHPPGSVVFERPDLLHGYIDRLVPMETANLSNLAAWVNICVNARLLQQGGT
jgi:hypothetical protein